MVYRRSIIQNLQTKWKETESEKKHGITDGSLYFIVYASILLFSFYNYSLISSSPVIGIGLIVCLILIPYSVTTYRFHKDGYPSKPNQQRAEPFIQYTLYCAFTPIVIKSLLILVGSILGIIYVSVLHSPIGAAILAYYGVSIFIFTITLELLASLIFTLGFVLLSYCTIRFSNS